MDDTTTSSVTQNEDQLPELPPDSPGSSVSSHFQEEYDEILKYAVVVPSYDPNAKPRTLRDTKGSFLDDEPPRQPPNPTAAAERVRFEDRVTAQTPISSCSQEHAVDADENDHHDDSQPRPYLVTMEMDADFPRMDSLLDDWTAELKKRVLAELSRLKSCMSDELHQQVAAERKKHQADVIKHQDDVIQLRHLVQTYETSIQRKDDVINNLTRALEHEKNKRDELKSFSEWKLQSVDKQREDFCARIAKQHYQRSLARRVYYHWRSMITNKWQQRVEKACQARASQVCVNLTNEYEARIAKMEEELSLGRDEIKCLNVERQNYEETMKKAFMRGVCALNVEAMNMFQETERRDFRETLQGITDVTGRSSPPHQMEPRPHSPKIVTAPAVGSATAQARTVHFAPLTKPVTTPSGKTGKPSSTRDQKSRATTTAGHVTANPQMSSIVVERHQPVNKQTIPHAMTAQYPRDCDDTLPTNQKPVKLTNQKPSSTQATTNQRSIYKRIAGQSDCSKTISHVTSVKVGDT